MDVPYALTLAINVVWFGLAFHLFGVRPRRALEMLTTRAEATEAFAASLRFLGGMNLGMSVLSAAELASWASSGSLPHWPLFFGSAVAHASQFAFNVPFALRGGRLGGAPWDVVKGPMAFIFAVDALCATVNGAMMLRAIS
jgi:hypothetical protein